MDGYLRTILFWLNREAVKQSPSGMWILLNCSSIIIINDLLHLLEQFRHITVAEDTGKGRALHNSR